MSLTVPDEEELRLHMRWDQKFTARELEYAEDSLQRATDLMEMASGVHEDITGGDDADLIMRITTQGILAMAHAIYVTSGEDKEAIYAPYNSERLGSYSYSKAQAAVTAGMSTGVDEFDFAVNMLRGTSNPIAMFDHTAEFVFVQPYAEARRRAELAAGTGDWPFPDPSP